MVKNLHANTADTGDSGSIPGSGRYPAGEKWQPNPVFLPGKFHEQRSLGGYSPWGCKESDTTMHIHVCTTDALRRASQSS